MRYALIDQSNLVVNIVELESAESFPTTLTKVLVGSNAVEPGDIYDPDQQTFRKAVGPFRRMLLNLTTDLFERKLSQVSGIQMDQTATRAEVMLMISTYVGLGAGAKALITGVCSAYLSHTEAIRSLSSVASLQAYDVRSGWPI